MDEVGEFDTMRQFQALIREFLTTHGVTVQGEIDVAVTRRWDKPFATLTISALVDR